MPEVIINVNVTLSTDHTVATVEWTSGQPGTFGYLLYAPGQPGMPNMNYSQVTLGPTSSPQNRFVVPVTGLNPKCSYVFFAETVLADGLTVVAVMSGPQYLLNPISVAGVSPVSGGFPLAGPIGLGRDRAINLAQGDIPDLRETLDGWFQNLVFEKVGKLVSSGTAFQAVETTTLLPFRGIVVPEKSWSLLLKPEAQRTWKFWKVYAEVSLKLFTDDVILWQGVQTRVTDVTDYSLYGYMEYSIAQDWTAKGPVA
jgi:hypothetical protein